MGNSLKATCISSEQTRSQERGAGAYPFEVQIQARGGAPGGSGLTSASHRKCARQLLRAPRHRLQSGGCGRRPQAAEITT